MGLNGWQHHCISGRTVQAHWRVLEEMRRLFPAVNAIDDQHVVEDGDVITSAGISAGIDMALRVIARHHGDAVARATAKYMELLFPGGQLRAGLIDCRIRRRAELPLVIDTIDDSIPDPTQISADCARKLQASQMG